MMILEHGHFSIVSSNSIPKNTTTNSSKMLSTHSTAPYYDRAKPKITALPSFSELLTSIPLPTAFKPRSNSNVSATSVNTSNSGSYIGLSSVPAPPSQRQQQQQQQQQQLQVYRPSPYSYYSQPSIQHRLPTPPPNHQQQNTPKQQYQYQYQYQYQVIGSNRTAFIAPQPVVSHRSSNADPLTPVSASMETKVRSSSISDIPISPAIANSSAASPYTQHHQQQTSPLQTSTTASSSATSPVLVNHVTKDSRRKHVCKVCSRSFTTSGHLARHNRIHTGERKHKCPWPTCDARFARQDNCMQHYKTHTNGKNKRSRKYVSQVKYGGVSIAGVGVGSMPPMHSHVVPILQNPQIFPSVSHLTR